MYLNDIIPIAAAVSSKGLTLTWDVFKLSIAT